jgi:glycosyltransferase involved in cell wall biosynthesis/predicted O-methyltransferase YrrM
MATAPENHWLRVLVPWAKARGPLNILEIGSVAEQPSRWFLDHLMSHPESRLTCTNLLQAHHTDRLTVLTGDPTTVLQPLPNASFDLIYVGCNQGVAGIYFDSLSAVRLIKSGGLVLWAGYFSSDSVKAGVDLAARVTRITMERLGNDACYGIEVSAGAEQSKAARLAKRAKRNIIDRPRRQLTELLGRKRHGSFSKNWFSMHEENWNQLLLPLKKKRQPVQILEVGSYDGQSACWLIKNFLSHPQSRLTCCDMWEQRSRDRVYEENMDEVYQRFQKNCQATGKWGQVRALRGDSKITLKALVGEQFDLIYVDGDHSAEGTYADTMLTYPLLAPGGLLLWDDYKWCDTVKEGVDRACRELGIVLESFGNNVSYRKPLAQSLADSRPTKIVGLVPARNEEARIEFCLRALAQFTDAIVYLDDCSTDETVARVEQIARDCRVERILRKPQWFRDEPGDRNRLLQAGREIGGTHFIVLDADEAFTANCQDQQMLRRLILSLPPGEQLAMTWIQLWRSLDYYRHDTSVWTNNVKSIAFRDDGRCSYESEFIHTARVPTNLAGARVALPGYEFGLLHFQFVNWRNLLIKQAWYRCLERIRDPQKPAGTINALYAPSQDESALGLKPALRSWFTYPFFDPAVADAPDLWRKTQIEAWLDQYGLDFFKSLDIWEINWRPQANAPKTPSVPRVSVLVSTCNSERFIRGCLEDLEAQTIADEMEIIVVDSGSEQNEAGVVKEFQQRYNNIVYIRTERETLYGAWNRAIGAARAPYLTNANTDDRHAPDALEKMADALDRQPGANVVYANCAVTQTPNAAFGAAPVCGHFRWPPFDRRLLFSVCFIGPQPMWRRSLHDQFGLFDAQLRSAGDYDFWLRISPQARFIHLPQTLGLYLEHPGSIEHTAPENAQREANAARQRHWPKEWGRMPKAVGNFFQPTASFPEIGTPQIAVTTPAPSVSVIVPTHSRPEMLREAVASILAQTFQDFEIIVVNDGGPDVSRIISHAKIVHLRHDQTRERSAARNTGLAAARGKYIAYLDDDDIFHPDHLQSLVAVLQVTGKKVAHSDACCAHQSRQNGQYKVVRRESCPPSDFNRSHLLAANSIPILCVLHEKSCLEATGGFDLQLATHEDWDLWIRLSRHFDFVHLKTVTCEFRARDDGSSTTSSSQKDFLRTAKLIYERYRMYAGKDPEISQRQQSLLDDLRQRNKPTPKDGIGWLKYRMARPFQNINRSLRKRLRKREPQH